MARAAERCFVSLRSCSSVRSSSCWIAPSVPTWYCIFVCRCLATGREFTASLARLPVRRPVEPERTLRRALQAVAELHRRGRPHPDAPLLASDDPAALLRDLHLQHRVPVLRGVLELLGPDAHELRLALALLDDLLPPREPQRAGAPERGPTRDAHPRHAAAQLHGTARDH